MNIQFTHEGRKAIIPFGDDWVPGERTLIMIQQQFPDAEIVDPIDDDLWEDQESFMTNSGYQAFYPFDGDRS